MKTLVIVAHPDDEALSCGGLIQNRLAAGDNVDLLVVFGRYYAGVSLTEARDLDDRQRQSLLKSVDILQADYPGNLRFFYQVEKEGEPQELGYYKLLFTIEPKLCGGYDEVVIPSPDDLNQDHRHLHDVCKIALRPANLGQVKRVLMWHAHDGGTPGTANWYEPMTHLQLDKKQFAVGVYEDERRVLPHPRCPDNITAHARQCGSKVACEFAEPFTLLLQRKKV